MTGKGALTTASARRMRWTLAAALAWFGTVCLLGAWWGTLLYDQARRIAELERTAGAEAHAVQVALLHTQRMLIWEGAFFFALLLGGAAVILWLYWRDLRRTRSLTAFFAGLTHELRTPLTSIRLQAESIADAAEPGSRQRLLSQRLLEDAHRIETQVERTLELARVEGGGRVLAESHPIRPLLNRILAAWKESGPEDVAVDVKADDSSALVDPAALQVIVRNLLENSLRHSRVSPLRVAIVAEREGDWLRLEVRDNGRGFEGDAQGLGELFSRGEGSSGAGVGLYLVRMLMDRMGGRAAFGPAGTAPGLARASGFEATLRFRTGEAHG